MYTLEQWFGEKGQGPLLTQFTWLYHHNNLDYAILGVTQCSANFRQHAYLTPEVVSLARSLWWMLWKGLVKSIWIRQRSQRNHSLSSRAIHLEFLLRTRLWRSEWGHVDAAVDWYLSFHHIITNTNTCCYLRGQDFIMAVHIKRLPKKPIIIVKIFGKKKRKKEVFKDNSLALNGHKFSQTIVNKLSRVWLRRNS